MGMSQAGDEFNMETDKSIHKFREDMMKTTLIDKSVDDVLICSETKEGLEAAVDRFFQICHKRGIKISMKKFQLAEKIVYGGVEINTSGE